MKRTRSVKQAKAAEYEQESSEDNFSDQEGEVEEEPYGSNEEYDSDGMEEDEDEDAGEDDNSLSAAEKMAKLKRDLAHVSFEQLAEIKNKMGMKEFSKARGTASAEEGKSSSKISKEKVLRDLKGAASKLKGERTKATKQDMKRTNKNSPMEMSSKRAVGRFREVVPLAAQKRRDPRFDKLSGHYNEDLFEKSYAFLDDYKKSEQAELKERIKKEKDPAEREKQQANLTKMLSRERSAQNTKRMQGLLRERKKAEAELVKQGKVPYFLKQSEKRKLELIDRYKQLGDKSVDRILEKRRKRNAAKDHRRVPFKRRSGGD